ESDVEPIEGPPDVGEDAVLRRLAEHGLVALPRERLPMLVAQRGGDLPDVVALVAVRGECRRTPEELEIPGAHRLPEHTHLATRVVEVIFAGGLVTHRFEESGHAIPEDPLPPVPERERPRRVGADELHHRALASTLGLAAKSLVLAQDLGEARAAVRGREEDVEESGAGHFRALDLVHARQMPQ